MAGGEGEALIPADLHVHVQKIDEHAIVIDPSAAERNRYHLKLAWFLTVMTCLVLTSYFCPDGGAEDGAVPKNLTPALAFSLFSEFVALLAAVCLVFRSMMRMCHGPGAVA